MNSSKDNKHLVFQATWAAIGVAFALVVTKTFAWWISGSLTIQASLLDSLSDFFSSMVNFFAVRYSAKPANNEYRFGHGKAEALAGFIQSFVIIASASWMVLHAYQHQSILEHSSHSFLAIAIMIFSTLLTFGLVLLQFYTIKRTNSVVIKADFLHYQADILSNIAAIIALVAISWFGISWIDNVLGAGIAVFLLLGSWNILKQSSNILMDKELAPAKRQDILKHILSHPKVIEAHDLRTRSTGQQDFIQVHITLDSTLSLEQAHVISDEVEETLKKFHPNSEIIIHLDPLGYTSSQGYL
ncbi:MAG: cation diffusion facilitator family transporter [Proteobacteria bacterium]|nr:cation diffusion facilitator family transporter [Pseudomonadota bacterium]